MKYNPIYLDIDPKKKKNKKSNIFNFFILFMLILFIISAIVAFIQYDKIAFYIQKDKYKIFEQECLNITRYKTINKDKIEKLLIKIQTLLKTYSNDPILYYYEGKLNAILFNKPIADSPDAITNIMFDVFLSKYKFYPYLDKNIWHKSIISFRKSLILNLPSKFKTDVYQNLAYLYLIGGEPYLQESLLFTEKITSENIKTKELLNVIFPKQIPNWENLTKFFNKDQINFLKSIYFLKIGNTPVAFSLLTQLTLLEIDNIANEQNLKEIDSTINITLINNSLYLLGYLNEINNNLQLKAKHLSKINAKYFIPQHKWFFDEYVYLLRFLGDFKTVDKFIAEYENVYLTSFK